ncbi:MAG: hypothetical protein LBQ90_03625 [Synergistaceae bacterium]|jgi:acyl dehydratase|nr:hypothetical protein [Synergistaceae bacterium]
MDADRIAWWEDAVVGDRRVTHARTVTEADVVTLCGLTGSYEPLHCDEEYAKTTVYGRRVVNGLMNLCIGEGLRGNMVWYNGDNFRGPSLIGFLGLNNARFTNPLFIGDTIHVETSILSKKETSKPGRGTITFLDQVFKQDGSIVAEWERTSLYKKRPVA